MVAKELKHRVNRSLERHGATKEQIVKFWRRFGNGGKKKLSNVGSWANSEGISMSDIEAGNIAMLLNKSSSTKQQRKKRRYVNKPKKPPFAVDLDVE